MPRSSVVFAVVVILQVAAGIVTKDNTAGEVNPCTDLSSYSCQVRNSTKSERWLMLEDILDNHLFNSEEPSDFVVDLYKFRQQCKQINVEDQRNFVRTFNPSVDGWPALNRNWNADKFDLQAALAKLHSFNCAVVFMTRLTNENRNHFRNQIHIEPSIENRMFNDASERRVKRKLSNVIVNVDEVISDSRIVESLFVAEKTSTDEDLSTDYKGLKREIPEIDWDKQFEIMYGQKVPDSFEVIIKQPGLLKRIIPKIFQVEPKVMANYLFYRLVSFIPDIDAPILPALFNDVAFDVLRYHYTSETKQELRGMFISLLNTLHNTTNLFRNDDKSSIEKAIREFVMDELLPDIDDSYFKNTYGKLTFSEGDCYSSVANLVYTSWKIQNQLHLKREVDPLYFMRFALINSLMHQLTPFLDKSSAIHFDVLMWNFLSDYFWRFWDKDELKPMQQCLENQPGEKINKLELEQVLILKIYTKAFFGWAKDNANLLQLEETKYNESSKEVFLNRLIAHYCVYHPKLGFGVHSSALSGVFRNMKEFSEVYNCPVGSEIDPRFACEFGHV